MSESIQSVIERMNRKSFDGWDVAGLIALGIFVGDWGAVGVLIWLGGVMVAVLVVKAVEDRKKKSDLPGVRPFGKTTSHVRKIEGDDGR